MESTGLRQDSLLFKYVKITAVVALYWVVSISMVFVNKALLGGSTMGEKDAPLFVTWFQCAVTVISCICLTQSARLFPHLVSFPEVGALEWQKVRQVLPLTLIFVGMITMNNLCLKSVGVSFYYVGRSLTTVINVIFMYLILGQKTSLPAIMCCATIIGGFLLGVDQETNAGSLSIVGVIFGIMASCFVSLNSIFTKKVLPAVDNSIWLLSYYNNCLACVVFVPLILVTGEGPAILALVTEGSFSFWGLMVVGGLCGFAIGYVTGLQIQVTSPLTHGISATAKACAQTVLATWWYNESKSVLWWTSNSVILGGSMAYTRVKQLEMKESYKTSKSLSSGNDKV